MHILNELEAFLMNELLLDSDLNGKSLTAEEDLISNGILDSMGILRLTSFIEEKFGIKVTDEDINPENFRTINCLKEFIESKQHR